MAVRETFTLKQIILPLSKHRQAKPEGRALWFFGEADPLRRSLCVSISLSLFLSLCSALSLFLFLSLSPAYSFGRPARSGGRASWVAREAGPLQGSRGAESPGSRCRFSAIGLSDSSFVFGPGFGFRSGRHALFQH